MCSEKEDYRLGVDERSSPLISCINSAGGGRGATVGLMLNMLTDCAVALEREGVGGAVAY